MKEKLDIKMLKKELREIKKEYIKLDRVALLLKSNPDINAKKIKVLEKDYLELENKIITANNLIEKKLSI